MVYYKWGDIVLGANQQDTTPDLDDSTWATAMFTSGMGLALFFFGVSEPIYNMEAALGDSSPYNAASQHGVFMTFYHFGLHTWAPFVLVGMLIGLAHYRHGLPLTVRSAFYPLLRERIFGFVGDAIDTISALCGLVGVSVPLGLACMQLSAGFNWHNSAFAWMKRNDGDTVSYQSPVAILFACNFLGLLSVGIPRAVHNMTAFATIFALFIALDVLFMENTWYILALLQQTAAFYFQKIVQVSQHLDVFENLDEGIGLPGGHQALSRFSVGWEGPGWITAVTAAAGNYSRETNFVRLHVGMRGNETVEPGIGAGGVGMVGGQWGWVMSMTPIAGMWIAKISKGRTIRQVLGLMLGLLWLMSTYHLGLMLGLLCSF